MSQMCTSWLFSARSKSAGTCQRTMTALKITKADHGVRQHTPDRPQGPCPPRQKQRSSDATSNRDRKDEEQRHPGCTRHDEIGAKNMMRMCSIMCTKK